jgi:hypothetical protein
LQWERPLHDPDDNAVYRCAELTLPARGSSPLKPAIRLLRIASGAILVLCVPRYALGITLWLELGAYLPLYTITGDEQALIDGAKVRALFVSPNAAERTFWYGVNFELSYNARHWQEARYALEIRHKASQSPLEIHPGRAESPPPQAGLRSALAKH